MARDELRAAAAPGEREGGVPGGDEARHELGGLDVRRRARAGRGVEQRPLPQREAAFALRGAVVVDEAHRRAEHRRRELGRVPDGGAGEAERGIAAVVRAHAPEPTEHVGEVTAEDAARRVQLVDHDVPQPHQERGPPLMEREDALMDHLRVGQHHRGVLAGPGAVVGWGVTVVGDGAQSGDEPAAQRSQLVLGEGLGGEDQQRGVLRAAHRGVDDRELVAERLARRGAGRDHHVLPRREQVDRRRLVRVELVHPTAREARVDIGMERRAQAARCVPHAPAASCGGRRVRRAPARRRSRRVSRRRPAPARGSPAQHRARVCPARPRPSARAPGWGQWVWSTPSSAKSWNRLAAPGPRARLLPEPLTTGTSTFFTCAGSIESPRRPSP